MMIIIYNSDRYQELRANFYIHQKVSRVLETSLGVIEDGSFNKETLELCKKYGAYYRASGTRRFGGAYTKNLAIACSLDDWVLTLDAEIIPLNIEQATKLKQEISLYPKSFLVIRNSRASREWLGKENIDQNALENAYGESFYGFEPCTIQDVSGVGAQINYYPCSLIKDVGWYNIAYDGYWGWEDVDLMCRVALKEHHVRWCPHIIFVHIQHEPASWKEPGNVRNRNYDYFLEQKAIYEATHKDGKEFLVDIGDLSRTSWDYVPE